jgi:hypothetical protein
MVSLLPATATVIGILVLAQVPSWLEVAGVTLVVSGVAIHREPQAQANPRRRATRQPSRGQVLHRAHAGGRASEVAMQDLTPSAHERL